MQQTFYVCLALLACLVIAGCSSSEPLSLDYASHRYFLEVERPGSVYSVLENRKYKGALIPIVELNENGQPGDTLQAWVQHFNGRSGFSSDADQADIVIACYREALPEYAQHMHVLPESNGKIYVYMMQGNVLVVSDERISFYEVLLAARGR